MVSSLDASPSFPVEVVQSKSPEQKLPDLSAVSKQVHPVESELPDLSAVSMQLQTTVSSPRRSGDPKLGAPGMDSSALLDYALLQLTPTRTRCDLVVVSGGKSEKIASGLVEPFVSHLKFAKDQIPRGGYSITLRPPIAHASWFTKNTVQRFMRFISTPEILERSVRIEREILEPRV